MINILWAFLIISGICLSFITGNIQPVVTGLTSSAIDSASLLLTLFGTYTLWLGILNIAKKSGLIEKISSYLNPVIAFLFKGIKKDSKANGLITLNIVANMLGMGNAATPFGLKAMEELQKSNPSKERPSDAMCMLLIINTTSVQLLPLTVISLRVAAGSTAPTQIILTSLITTTITTTSGIILGKLYAFFKSKSKAIQS
jgi:spore maturation protein A